MAGIGFELKKLFNKKGYASNIAAYFYSAIVIVGPMITCMMIIVFYNIYLDLIGVTKPGIDLLISTIVYSFIFSIIITGGFVYIISRYVSDKIFSGEFGKILPSLYGSQVVVLIVSGISGFIFLSFSPLGIIYKLLAYLLFVEISMLWIEIVYISALRNYMKILRSFLFGALIQIGLTITLTNIFAGDPIILALMSTVFGFFFIVLTLGIYIKQFYFHFDSGILIFLTYFKKFKYLFLTGFFITLGAYIHIILFWFSKDSVIVAETFAICPNYDAPVFYSLLTIIPSMVLFVVSVETRFYSKYKAFYSSIINGGIIKEIKFAKTDMINVLVQEMTFIMEFQLFISFLSITIGAKILPFIGFTRTMTDTFSILVLGSFSYVMMVIVIMVLLYFDDIKGTLIISIIFLATNFVLTLSVLQLGIDYNGMGYFISGFISLIVSLSRLGYFIKNIDYYTYCKQPLYNMDKMMVFKVGFIEKLK